MDKHAALEVVTPFYTQALTVHANTTPTAVLEKILSEDFQSVNGQETKTRAVLAGQLEFFWKLIPDLKWEPKDYVFEGNKVVVRSVATGTPKGNFMGLPTDGTRSFKIDTIDIHELANGRVVRVYHLEDWATAMRQLSGK